MFKKLCIIALIGYNYHNSHTFNNIEKKMIKKIILSLSLITLSSAQDLKTVVEDVISTNPIVIERLKNYNIAKEDIDIAKAGYYPKLDLSLGVGIENTHKSGLDATPSSESSNLSVYRNSLTYTHNLFNGFETTYSVQQEKNKTIAAAYSYIEQVNDVVYDTVDIYLEIIKNYELLEISKENVTITNDIFKKVQQLYESGLTTLSEVNKIESSLSLAKANLIVQENTLENILQKMKRVLGRDVNPKNLSVPAFNVKLPQNLDIATQYAMLHNPSLLVSDYNIKLAQAAYKKDKSSFLPSVDLEVKQAINKNLSAVEGEDNRFSAMVYLTYNLFNGYSDSTQRQKNISTIHQEIQIKNKLRREVIEGISLSWISNEKISQQLIHLKDYEKFANKTLTLYSKEYDLGRRSLLDLLSAQNDYTGSKSQIVEAKYNALFAKYRILDAMGTLVESISQENNNIAYENVGLKGQAPKNNDSLPIFFDTDNDLIPDNTDICSNSLSSELKNNFGCKDTDINPNIKSIERYNGFLFESKSTNLTIDGQKRLNALIRQLKPYGLNKIEFDLFGNAKDDESTEEEFLLLSKLRAKKIENELIKAGALSSKITIFAKSNTSPMYSDENKEFNKLNNRVDIIIKKIK